LNIHDKSQREGYRIVSLSNGMYPLEVLKDDDYFVLCGDSLFPSSNQSQPKKER
jgi:hypothetical protein